MHFDFKGLGAIFVLAIIGLVLGGYELIRLAVWLFNHIRIV